MTVHRAKVVAIGLHIVLAPLVATADPREPNALELAYTAMVLDGGSHELCERISHDAVSRFLFNSPGTQIYRERSRCFLYAAVNTFNSYLCQFVVDSSGWFHDGSYFSHKNCEVLVEAGTAFNFSLSFDRRLVLTEMGYSVAEIAETYPRDLEEVALQRFYLDAVGGDRDFQKRLSRLPDFSSGEP